MIKQTLDQQLINQQRDVELYLEATADARAMNEKCRDYVDGKQLTEAQISRLKGRGQAPIIVNRIKPKHQGLIGLLDLRRSDPKAYPRTKKHEKSAEAITDGLRYVADNNDFNATCRLDAADEFFCEGTCGAIIDIKQKKDGDTEVRIQQIPWDRIYYDPFSRKLDFSDARFKGIILWMDIDQFTVMFPDADAGQVLNANNYDETFADKPAWLDKAQRRVRVAMHYYLDGENWKVSYFTDKMFLIEPEDSPYLDEDGQPFCPIELQSANISRSNDRYGEVRSFLDQQDEINHRRSKALHLLSQRQTFGRKGEAKDIANIKRELSKPNGHVEFTGEQFGRDFGVLPTGDMAQGQLQLYADAKSELDSVSFNAQLAGERSSGNLSGKAIDRLQQAGTIELNRQYTLFSSWEKRIYRQVWWRIKQFWNSEKWIRVTDDQDNLRWVGLNGQLTAQEFLEETINDKSISIIKRKQAAATFRFFMDALEGQDMQAAQIAEQNLNQIVGVKNPVPELDVDVILDQSFDSINIQQEQFETLVKFASNADIDITELIELSQLRGKEDLIDKINKRRSATQEASGGAQQIQIQQAQANVRKVMADGAKAEQDAIGKKIENTIIVTNPNKITSVAI